MTGLKPHARELIDAASRHEALPSAERMARVRAGVLRRAAMGGIAVSAGSTSLWAGAAAKVTAWGSGGFAQIAAYVAVGAIAGGAVVELAPRSGGERRHETPAATVVAAPTRVAPIAPRTAPALPPAVEIAPPILPPEGASPSPAPTARQAADVRPPAPLSASTARAEPTAPEPVIAPVAERDPSAPALVKAPDALARQLEALRRMRSDLAARQGARALSLYRESESLFRGGALEPEARAALIAALCELGRTDEARREIDQFQLAFPKSDLARRLSAGCEVIGPSDSPR
jgi:hypothetical protein